jgi:hypothetical protein
MLMTPARTMIVRTLAVISKILRRLDPYHD